MQELRTRLLAAIEDRVDRAEEVQVNCTGQILDVLHGPFSRASAEPYTPQIYRLTDDDACAAMPARSRPFWLLVFAIAGQAFESFVLPRFPDAAWADFCQGILGSPLVFLALAVPPERHGRTFWDYVRDMASLS